MSERKRRKRGRPPLPGGVVRWNLWLPRALAERLDKYARRKRRSKADVGREALEEYLERVEDDERDAE